MSSDIEKNPSMLHGPSALFMSTASGERKDALPQTPECTNSAGLFKEATGMDQSKHSNSSSVTLFIGMNLSHYCLFIVINEEKKCKQS